MIRLLRLHPQDNVAVALAALRVGEQAEMDGIMVTARESIPAGHKLSLQAVAAGEPVIRYGLPIGTAAADIPSGSWVHSHNLRTALDEGGAYTYSPRRYALPDVCPRTFRGYSRADGRAGIRNELWVIPTVGCVNDICKRLAANGAALAREYGLDGVWAFPHPFGCSQLGGDHQQTRRLLAALCRHPNTGGVLVVGLGCENNTLDSFREQFGAEELPRLRFLHCQSAGDEIAEGGALLRELAEQAARDRREELPLSRLTVGFKCGGSDGLSGITANPAVGAFCDRLCALDGRAVLTEVPEMFGAESVLLPRCRDRATFDKAVAMIQGFKQYFADHGQPVYENPSPGNKDGGITTLEEKSIGCVQKGGLSPINGVLEYGERVEEAGLSLLCGPGNDLVSATALTAAGANMVLFTTGRGTPFGAPAPTLKIATNSDLAARKPHWIDFDAGPVAAGESVDEAGERLLDMVVAVASGELRTQTELHGYREIAIWKNGVTL